MRDILIIVLLISCLNADTKDIRMPVVAGRFYPRNASELKQMVTGFLDQCEIRHADRTVSALVVPHAGYPFSGRIAACAFKEVSRQSFDLAIVLAPSHREAFQGATLYPGDAYQTPLGEITIDQKAAKKLLTSCPVLNSSKTGHLYEHAVEVVLPFLQVLNPELKFIPIVMGQCDYDACQELARCIADLYAQYNILLIASSDLYHGYSYSECVRSSKATLNAIVELEPEPLFRGFVNQSFSACGAEAVVTVSKAAGLMGAHKPEILCETNSGDVSGDKSGYVVGYGAVAFYQPESVIDKTEYPQLKLGAQQELMRLARQALEYRVRGIAFEPVPPQHQENNDKRGVFVTLLRDGHLRGCIGRHIGNKPLYRLVPEMTAAAAFQDHRFAPVGPDEVDDIDIKISVYLSDPCRIQSVHDYHPGEHGIILYKSNRSATFLPHVPEEAGWDDVEQVMRNLCWKAGLDKDDWKQDALLWVYKTQVFDQTVLEK